MAAKSRATIADVARLAGVSTATAGRVLGGYGYSSEETRQQVEQAAQKLGYRANALARSLITGKTRTIGVVAGDIQNPFYASILRGIADVAEKQEFGLLIMNSDESLEREIRAVNLLLEKQVDGLIVSPCDTRDAGHLRSLHASGVPLVLIDRGVAGLEVDRISTENIGAAERATRLLIDAGHRRIGVVAELVEPPEGGIEGFVQRGLAGETLFTDTLYPSWQRILGYLRAHRKAGVEPDPALIWRVGAYSADMAQGVVDERLAGGDLPTALFATDGTMSEGVMRAIARTGLTIPGDISLVCFDDLDWMGFLRPGITTVAQPRMAMGAEAARMLMERISGIDSPGRSRLLQGVFMQRGSVAPPKSA